MKPLQQQTSSYRYFVPSLRVKAENVVTDRQTEIDTQTDRQTYGTSTVTLAAHAHRGLIRASVDALAITRVKSHVIRVKTANKFGEN